MSSYLVSFLSLGYFVLYAVFKVRPDKLDQSIRFGFISHQKTESFLSVLSSPVKPVLLG